MQPHHNGVAACLLQFVEHLHEERLRCLGDDTLHELVENDAVDSLTLRGRRQRVLYAGTIQRCG